MKPVKLWIAAHVLIKPDVMNTWALIGVFSSRQRAIKACFNEQSFVAPMMLNVKGPEEICVFENVFYPLRKEEQDAQ
jgi:hypothetical protein